MEKIWHHVFYNQLQIDPSDYAVLLTEALMNPKDNREKMAEIMFETFNVQSFYVAYQPALSLYASGHKTGMFVDIGNSISHFLPIYEMTLYTHEAIKQNFAGCHLTRWLQKLLKEQSYNFTSFAEKEILRDIKEKHCYVAIDYDAELKKARSSDKCDVTYALPGKRSITIGDERFRCPELLFKPYLNGFEFEGIDQNIFDSINKCEKDLQNDFYSNIMLSGGTVLFEGFPERLEKEVRLLASPKTDIRILRHPDSKYGAWVGGSIFVSITTFAGLVITRVDYNDSGPAIVHNKC